MKKSSILGISLIFASIALTACAGGETSTDKPEESPSSTSVFEVQHKTEKEVVRVADGMIPQVIEKNVTYALTKEGGEWEVESSEITNWGWEDDFVIVDTAWYVESEDASTLYSNLDPSLSGKPAKMYLYFGNDLWNLRPSVTQDENGTPKLDLDLSMNGRIIFECGGEKFYFDDLKSTGADVYEDGTVHVSLSNAGEDAGVITVPADVKKISTDEFNAAIPSPEERMRAESSTYIDTVAFADIPQFAVTSSNLKDCVWDVVITNTKYGENLSPELSWEPVEGASGYAVIMIDGAWLHMEVLTDKTSLAAGEIAGKEPGDRYVGPYPPSGTHTYTVFVFALKGDSGYVELHFDAGNNVVDKIYSALDHDPDGNTGNVLAYGRLDGNYTHQD